MSFPLEKVKKSKILVVGDVMLDRYWFGEVNRISPEAPVPVVRVAKREDRLGGAANVARNIASLGAQVSLFGLIGQDESGQVIEDLTIKDGINSLLISDAGIHTILKMRVLGRQQQLIRIDFEELPSQNLLDKLYENIKSVIQDYDVIVLSDYAKGALGQVQKIIDIAKQSNKVVLIDPKGDDYKKYFGANIMTPNKSEMIQAVGDWDTEETLYNKAQKLRASLDLDALLVTRSEEGMSLFTEQGSEHVSANAHEVFDVSGAGDTVLATLAVCKAAGLDWVEAMNWANRAGAVVVGKLGTSVVTPQELI